jgi:AdoMet-dependent heme synthase
MIVVWRITQRCNLSCPFCAYDQRVNRSRRDADAEIIQRFGAVLSEYQQESGDMVLVSWIGGEPFLFPALDRLTRHFTSELGLRVSATTNGTALRNASLCEHILEHYAELTISVDGVGSVHDELRGWPDGYPSLRTAVRKLSESKRAENRGPLLRANVVLMRHTINDFERLCLELADWGIEEITFNQLGGRDRPEFFPTHRLLPEQAGSLNQEVSRIRARLATLGVCLKGSPAYLARIQASSSDELIPLEDCRPGEQFLFVNENGMAAPCNFTAQDYGVAVTELTNAQSLRKLPLIFAQAQSKHRSAFCNDCHSTRVFDKFTT